MRAPNPYALYSEGDDILTTESGDRLLIEFFIPEPPPPPATAHLLTENFNRIITENGIALITEEIVTT